MAGTITPITAGTIIRFYPNISGDDSPEKHEVLLTRRSYFITA
jgi:hypothetical protein